MFVAYRHPQPAGARSTSPRTCTSRLHNDPHLHTAFRHLHRCGPRAVGHYVAELLYRLGAPPAALDEVLLWRSLDPDIVTAVGGSDFPPVTLRVVPR